jgi:Fic family protein
MQISIGKERQQKEGFLAFVPAPYPPAGLFEFSQQTLIKADEAGRLIGKLDGITHTLPDVDFFLSMFVNKDATSSAQIEGTKATLVDALEMDAGVASKKTDADDILFYVKALNYGIGRLGEFPFSLRFIRELHSQLMTEARSTHFADPGEFRRTQNWIGGTSPSNALYVPPPVPDMRDALDDFEKFLRTKDLTLPIIHAALMHAQFETIHPFLDGNGRTGRLLITMLLYERGLLERPVLFLSSYFKKHQKVYYLRLDGYHNGEVEEWVNFFLDGIIETALDAIRISKEITRLREHDMEKLLALAKRESESGVLVMRNLYAQPIVTTRSVMEWTEFSRTGAQKVIDRFIKLGILDARGEEGTYDRTYVYKKYLNIFLK